MRSQKTIWGCKIISPKTLNFHHSLLGRVDIKDVAREIDFFKEILVLPNGSINIYTESLTTTIEDIEKLVRKIEREYSN